MKDETYIGHTIHYRETNISFKNKRRIRKPQSEWVRVENTQEPIISEQAVSYTHLKRRFSVIRT